MEILTLQFIQLRSAVQKWAEEEVSPRAAQIDKSNEFPNDLWKKMGSMGYLGITAPGR
jgi:isovaleryl-CoA dehydrogenase